MYSSLSAFSSTYSIWLILSFLSHSEYHVPALEMDNVIFNNGVAHLEARNQKIIDAAANAKNIFNTVANQLPASITLVGDQAGWIGGPRIALHQSNSSDYTKVRGKE